MSFKGYEDELLNLIFNPFDWDKNSYKFTREEKDMNPYSIKDNKEKQTVTIVHNVVGINKEDLELVKKVENGRTYIVIKGQTTDSITGKVYSINSRFRIDESQLNLSKAKSSAKNGLLYITIPYKKEKRQETKLEIQ